MARATTGGRSPVGGQRRSCRRLLPTFLLLAVLVPGTARAAGTNAEAWVDAREVQKTHSAAIASAAQAFADGGDENEVLELRHQVSAAVLAMDRLDVRDCFRVWWSYVRTSYVMFDQAVMGLQASDLTRVQVATAASTFLDQLAAQTTVDCTRDSHARRTSTGLGPRGGHPFADAITHGQRAPSTGIGMGLSVTGAP